MKTFLTILTFASICQFANAADRIPYQTYTDSVLIYPNPDWVAKGKPGFWGHLRCEGDQVTLNMLFQGSFSLASSAEKVAELQFSLNGADKTLLLQSVPIGKMIPRTYRPSIPWNALDQSLCGDSQKSDFEKVDFEFSENVVQVVDTFSVGLCSRTSVQADHFSDHKVYKFPVYHTYEILTAQGQRVILQFQKMIGSSLTADSPFDGGCENERMKFMR